LGWALVQAESKFSQIQPSPAKRKQNGSKKKACIPLDSVVRFEPFQRVAATPRRIIVLEPPPRPSVLTDNDFSCLPGSPDAFDLDAILPGAAILSCPFSFPPLQKTEINLPVIPYFSNR
jgi:hypothetical protein